MRRTSSLLVVVAIACAAACSSSMDPGAASSSDGGAALPEPTSTGAPTSSPDASPPPPAGDAGADAGPTGRDLSTDKSKFLGATSRCSTAGVQLCDDFEGAAIDTATWQVTGGASVTIDGVQHARGAKALHITKNGSGAAYIKETKTFPAKNDTYFGRVFVWFEKLPAPSGAFTYSHWTFIAASGTNVSGEIRVSGQLQNGLNHFGVGTDNRVDAKGTGDWTTSDDDPKGAPLPVPQHQWVCIEWMHKGDTNETRFWWDAVEHPSLYTSATQHGGNTNPYILPDFTNVWVGWQEYQATTEPFEMWLDAVAIDGARIGCVL